MTPFSDLDIRDRAYALWEQAGRPEGQDMEFWILAERELAAHEHHATPAQATHEGHADHGQPLLDQDVADQEPGADDRTDEQLHAY